MENTTATQPIAGSGKLCMTRCARSLSCVIAAQHLWRCRGKYHTSFVGLVKRESHPFWGGCANQKLCLRGSWSRNEQIRDYSVQKVSRISASSPTSSASKIDSAGGSQTRAFTVELHILRSALYSYPERLSTVRPPILALGRRPTPAARRYRSCSP